MRDDEFVADDPLDAVHDGRARTAGPGRRGLRRAARSLVRVGAVLGLLSLVVALAAGWMTRSLLDHVRDNSALLVDGSAVVELDQGDHRSIYVSGGAVAPGEDVPTAVEDITCSVQGPAGEVPFEALIDEGRKVGIDNPLARFQLVGSFAAQQDGPHEVTCSGAGLSVAPEVAPAPVVARVGALLLGSLGAFAGLSMLLIGALLTLFSRGDSTEDDLDDDEIDGDVDQDQEGSGWWREGEADLDHEAVADPDAPGLEDTDGWDDTERFDDGRIDEEAPAAAYPHADEGLPGEPRHGSGQDSREP